MASTLYGIGVNATANILKKAFFEHILAFTISITFFKII
jgi:hypothetical protein